MTTEEADLLIDEINRIAEKIEKDEELRALDPRYAIAAKWCECDPDTVTLEVSHGRQ